MLSRLFQTVVCSFTVRRTQYDRLFQQQLSFLWNLFAGLNKSVT